jgi:hypothetical protein
MGFFMRQFISLARLKRIGNTLETWVFVAILVLSGFLVIACGVKEAEFNLPLLAVGTATASFSVLIVVKKFRQLLSRI